MTPPIIRDKLLSGTISVVNRTIENPEFDADVILKQYTLVNINKSNPTKILMEKTPNIPKFIYISGNHGKLYEVESSDSDDKYPYF